MTLFVLQQATFSQMTSHMYANG